MNKRPISITLIGWFFIALGSLVILANVAELVRIQGTEDRGEIDAHEMHDLVWVLGTQLWAIMAGVFLLRGANWARWLTVAWLAFHVFLGAHHDFHSTAVHGALLAVGVYLLFRAPANEFFRGAKQPAGE
jgi:hypothetical protein